MLTICIVCIIKLTTTHVCELCFGVAIFSPLHVDTNLLPTWYFTLCEYVGYDGFIGGVSSVNIGLYIDMNQHKVGAMT